MGRIQKVYSSLRGQNEQKEGVKKKRGTCVEQQNKRSQLLIDIEIDLLILEEEEKEEVEVVVMG